MRVALIQMLVTADKAANLRSACEKIRAAKQAGADIGRTAGDVLLFL